MKKTRVCDGWYILAAHYNFNDDGGDNDEIVVVSMNYGWMDVRVVQEWNRNYGRLGGA